MTMYRARVDQVDGWRVRAGGKWLRCIGNRAVRVGELVWTDGRCVYGYDKDGVQPIVITNPQKPPEEFGIPIKDNKGFYLFDTALHFNGEHNNSYGIINNVSKVFYLHTENTDEEIIAGNCDKLGDTYALTRQAINGFRLIDGADNCQYYILRIYKNNEVVKTISTKDYAKEANTLCRNQIPVCPQAEQFDTSATIGWGFIENADNWAFIVIAGTIGNTDPTAWELATDITWSDYLDAHSDDPSVTPPTEHDIGVTYMSLFKGIDENKCWYEKAYYVDSTGNQLTLFTLNVKQVYYIDEMSGLHIVSARRVTENNSLEISDSLNNFHFPMQDGFYFTMTPIPYSKFFSHITGAPPFAEKTIYSPEGNKIWGGYTLFFTNMIATPVINKQNYLIDFFTPNIHRAYDLPNLWELDDLEGFDDEEGYQEIRTSISNRGTYNYNRHVLINYQNNLETKLLDNTLNFTLRKMKDPKNWFNKIN